MVFYISLYLSKLVSFFIRFFRQGAGHTLPGHLFLKLNPNIFKSHKIHFPRGIILISGTNGKTTTAKLVAHMLFAQNLRVLSNVTGANLLNGIVSSIVLNMGLTGTLKYDVAVFEVDEFTLPLVLERMSPRILVLLNLSRDQLDRYGETDIILNKWEKSISNLSENTHIIFDQTEEKFRNIRKVFRGPVLTFDASEENLNNTPLKGIFNAKNVNAALQVCMLLGYKNYELLPSLKTFESAYGRGEIIPYKGKEFHIFLAKNPASFNNNLRILAHFETEKTALVFVLNDNIPDGRDVSWIYDVEGNLLHRSLVGFKEIYVSGTRYLDMAVRLKYTDIAINEAYIIKDLEKALQKVAENKNITQILVFPNYSAMLETRKALTGKAIL